MHLPFYLFFIKQVVASICVYCVLVCLGEFLNKKWIFLAKPMIRIGSFLLGLMNQMCFDVGGDVYINPFTCSLLNK